VSTEKHLRARQPFSAYSITEGKRTNKQTREAKKKKPRNTRQTETANEAHMQNILKENKRQEIRANLGGKIEEQEEGEEH